MKTYYGTQMDFVKAMLKHAGKTQADLARFLGLTPATIHSNLSQGRLDYDRLCSLAEWCGCSVEMSVTFDDDDLTLSRKAVYQKDTKKMEKVLTE